MHLTKKLLQIVAIFLLSLLLVGFTIYIETEKMLVSTVEIQDRIPYESKIVLDKNLTKGKSKLLQKGNNGSRSTMHAVYWKDGQEVGHELIESVTKKEMVTEVTALGIKGGELKADNKNMISPKEIMYLEATAYTHTGNNTCTGVYPCIGTIAVDPRVIPLGTPMWVEGYGYGVAQDTGGLIKGKIIDVFMDAEKECFLWGRRRVKVYILE